MPEKLILSAVSKLQGTFTPPGDKSISHRALMLGALAQGKTVIRGFLRAEDCLCTWSALQSLGVKIEDQGERIVVHGRGLWGLKEPAGVLDLGNSGTSMRLLSGILAAQPFNSVLTGDESLQKRPMQRIIEPLRLMGAHISGQTEKNLAPLTIQGGSLKPIQYKLKQASAQVKSAILLAGLFADGVTTVIEPSPSRDHTERMLKAMGAKIIRKGLVVTLEGQPRLRGIEIDVPGDLSAAAFFIAAALIIPNSQLTIKNVGLNPTRIGFLQAVRQMGGRVKILRRYQAGEEPVNELDGILRSYAGEEPGGDLLVQSSQLHGISVQGDLVPRMIDEFPILGVLAAVAEGETVIRQAAELRVKESDRISSLAAELRKAGVVVEEYPDGMKIQGGAKLKGAAFSSHGDHRLAMSMAVAALVADGESQIEDLACVQTSFPGFFELLGRLTGQELRKTIC